MELPIIKVLDKYVKKGDWKKLEEMANNSDLPEEIKVEAEKRIVKAVKNRINLVEH